MQNYGEKFMEHLLYYLGMFLARSETEMRVDCIHDAQHLSSQGIKLSTSPTFSLGWQVTPSKVEEGAGVEETKVFLADFAHLVGFLRVQAGLVGL